MRPAPYFAMVKDGLVAVRASVFAFVFVSVFDNDEAEPVFSLCQGSRAV